MLWLRSSSPSAPLSFPGDTHLLPLLLPCPRPTPQEAPTPSLPLYSEEWVEELLSRVFAIITNLDSPEHRGQCLSSLVH